MILAAKAVGCTFQMGADEAGTMSRLRALLAEEIEPLLIEHRGRLFTATNDAFITTS